MHPFFLRALCCPVAIVLAWSAAVDAAPPDSGRRASGAGDRDAHDFVFRDVAAEAGALPHLSGLRSHGAAWGDVDGDGWPELFVAQFHNAGSQPSIFLRNEHGRFRADSQELLRTSGAGSGALFVDLTNNGRLDLYVSNCAHPSRDIQLTAPSMLLRNEGGGTFSDVSKASGACPLSYAGRGLTALDFDGDGLLDLLTCERYYGDVQTGPALYRNLGGHRFENVAEGAGLPVGLAGLAVAAADVNQDGWPDVFLTIGSGDCRLYLNDQHGKFREAPGSREVFRWNCSSNDTPAGVSIADINRDGLPDIVIGNHFKRPWIVPAPIRLYLHRGLRDGNPVYEDVTEAVGLPPLEMKAPHVEIQDFDNDGWPDIYTSVVKFAGGRAYPLIFKNMGVVDGLPRFREDVWRVNDFPSAADRAARTSTQFFEKMLADKKITYSAAAPSGDFDRDGRLDLVVAPWWTAEHSLLLRNETPGGHWLDVEVEGSGDINRMGLGTKVRVYPAGQRNASTLLGEREICVGYGYCAGQEAVAHFGLGDVTTVDVEVILPRGKETMTRVDVAADQRIRLAVAGKQPAANASTSNTSSDATNDKPADALADTLTQAPTIKPANANAAGGKSAKAQAKPKPETRKRASDEHPPFPPVLPDGKQVVTDTSDEFLQPLETLAAGVAIAKTPPTIDFMYFPGQDYEGKPWSNWGDSLAINGKYYASIGDHLAIGAKGNGSNGVGTGLVFEYDPATKTMRELVNTTKFLKLPAGHYAPGKVHSRLDMGSDGWLYFATHRGSDKATTDAFHYEGDWVLRCNPSDGRTEVVVHGPVPKHAIPTSVVDPVRMIFYGSTAPGVDSSDQEINFFAYDLKNRKMLYAGPDGPSRCVALAASSTGKVCYTQGQAGLSGDGALMRYDPAVGGAPVKIDGTIGMRAATRETPQGIIYVVSQANKRANNDAALYALNVKNETIENLGPAKVGVASYIASIDADPTGRYLYYVGGAHGGAEIDGVPIVQYDTKTNKKKVLAFLHPFYQKKYGALLRGTFSSALDPQGDKLYVTWNVSRGSRVWDSCALTVIHIPESERRP